MYSPRKLFWMGLAKTACDIIIIGCVFTVVVGGFVVVMVAIANSRLVP